MIEKNDKGLFEAVVDGETYEFEKWGADESTKTMLKIVKLVGKPLGLSIGAVFGGKKELKLGLDTAISPEMIAMVVDALTTNFDEDAVFSLIKKLTTEKVLYDGKKIDYNRHFQDRLPHAFSVLATAMEVQYGNFFAALQDLLGAPKAKKTTTLTSAM